MTSILIPPPPSPQNVTWLQPVYVPPPRDLELVVMTGDEARFATGKSIPVLRIPSHEGPLLLNLAQLRSILAIMETEGVDSPRG